MRIAWKGLESVASGSMASGNDPENQIRFCGSEQSSVPLAD
jgi:hypothetical protein